MAFSSQHHSFDIQLASQYGIEEAIVIHHFQHWIRINQIAKRNIIDGRCWSYQTRKFILEHYPYWSFGQIRRICESLVERGVLVVEKFNDSKFIHTLWYAFADEKLFGVDFESSIKLYEGQKRHIPEIKENLTKGKNDISKGKFASRCAEIDTCITDTKSSDPKTKEEESILTDAKEKSATPPSPSENSFFKGKFEEKIQVTPDQYERLLKKYALPSLIEEYAEKIYRWALTNPNEFKKKKRHDMVIETWIEKDLKKRPMAKEPEAWEEKELNDAQKKNWRENKQLVQDLKTELPVRCKGLSFYFKAHLLKDSSNGGFDLIGLMNPVDFKRLLLKHLGIKDKQDEQIYSN